MQENEFYEGGLRDIANGLWRGSYNRFVFTEYIRS